MRQRFQIDGREYNMLDVSEEGRELVARLSFIKLKINEMNKQMALLAKAKNAYINDLKAEIIQTRTGVDFGDLFSND